MRASHKLLVMAFKQKFPIQGMRCSTCVHKIENALLKQLPAGAEVAVSLTKMEALVIVPSSADLFLVPKAIREAGYRVGAEKAPLSSSRLVYSSAAFASITTLASHFFFDDPVFASAAAFSTLLAAKSIFSNSFKGGMDTLVSLGAGASYLASVISLAAPSGSGCLADGHHTGSMILTFVLIGRAIEHHQRMRVKQLMSMSRSQLPSHAKVRKNSSSTFVDLKEASLLQSGDVVIVPSGERIPCDGVVTRGGSECDESLLTGESIPVTRNVGDRVLAGSINLAQPLEVRVLYSKDRSLLGSIEESVESAQMTKASVQKLVDRVSGVFTPAVTGIAGVTAVAWGFVGGGFESAVQHSLSVLLIACPCALGLATPVAIQAASVWGARRGILFRDVTVLERLEIVSNVVFDKTGTLVGPTAVRAFVVKSNKLKEPVLLSLAYSLSVHSSHPVAAAVTQFISSSTTIDWRQFVSLSSLSLSDVVETPGVGMTCLIADASNLGRLPQQLELRRSPKKELSEVDLLLDGDVLGSFILDRFAVEPSAYRVVQSLQRRGMNVFIASGDAEDMVRQTARELGVSGWKARMTPIEKEAWVHSLRPVAFVGDGINDGPALAAADVGISMGKGSPLAQSASDATLVYNRLEGVIEAIDLARATRRVIKQNLVCGFGFNLVAIPFAAIYGIAPHYAAALMATSSIVVVANSIRLMAFSGSVHKEKTFSVGKKN